MAYLKITPKIFCVFCLVQEETRGQQDWSTALQRGMRLFSRGSRSIPAAVLALPNLSLVKAPSQTVHSQILGWDRGILGVFLFHFSDK